MRDLTITYSRSIWCAQGTRVCWIVTYWHVFPWVQYALDNIGSTMIRYVTIFDYNTRTAKQKKEHDWSFIVYPGSMCLTRSLENGLGWTEYTRITILFRMTSILSAQNPICETAQAFLSPSSWRMLCYVRCLNVGYSICDWKSRQKT